MIQLIVRGVSPDGGKICVTGSFKPGLKEWGSYRWCQT